MAEAQMVEWLIADCDAAPDEIELMGTHQRGDERFYVFRFRYLAEGRDDMQSNRWLCGIAGPWPPQGLEPLSDRCAAFSQLRLADAMTLEEHVADLLR